MNKILYFLFFFQSIFSLKSQSLNDIEIQFDSISNKFSVRQLIIINKLDISKEDYLYLYDWNNSYSSFNSPLSKKLYSEYDSSLLKPQANLSGRTNIKNILVNGVVVDWVRLDKNIDMKINVDPNILGGMILRVDNSIIDGSIKTQLNKIRKNFTLK